MTYTYDPTGTLSSNLITGELHTVTEANYRDYYFLIPENSPFFLNNLVLVYTSDVETRTLVTGIDYYPCLLYEAATRSLGIPVYGGISISNLLVTGEVSISYQTIGGDYVADKSTIITRLAVAVFNPKITLWDSLTNVPEIWPPNPHLNDSSLLYGQDQVIEKLTDITNAILSSNDVMSPYALHILDINNPHRTTANQLGLGLITNLPLANDNDIANSLPVDKYVTLKQVLNLGVGSGIGLQGPQGNTGSQGPQGSQGAMGSQGATGSVTVIPSYIFGGFLQGVPSVSQKVKHVFTSTIMFPSSLSASQLLADISATSTTVFDIKKFTSGTWTTIGSATVASSETVATFAMATDETFNAGDAIMFVAPEIPDLTLADISFSILGTRVI
jgi:hypothetical protein